MLLVHPVAALFVENCARQEIRDLAENLLVGEAWSVAGELIPKKPYRGQVALCIALEQALSPPKGSATQGAASRWNAKVLKMAAKLKGELLLAPPNLVASKTTADIPPDWLEYVVDPLQVLMVRLNDPRFHHTLQAGQAVSHDKFFIRTMTLAWRGLGAGDGYRLTASLVRALFERQTFTEAHCRRDATTQELPGKSLPWGWGLNDEDWLRAIKELLLTAGYRNSAKTA